MVAPLLILAGIQAGLTAVNAYTTAEAIKRESRHQQHVLNYNAMQADRQAKESIQRGGTQALKLVGRGRMFAGAQDVALADSGIQTDTGSAAMLRERTKELVELDALEIRKQAYLEAWGYESQAIQYRAQAKFTRRAAKGKVLSTYLEAITGIAGIGLQAGYNAKQTATSGAIEGKQARGRQMLEDMKAGKLERDPRIDWLLQP